MSPNIMFGLVSQKPNDEKKHMIKNFLGHQAEGKRLWQHNSWFIDFPAQFFLTGVLRKSKAISEFVGCCYVSLANGHKHTHTDKHTGEQPYAPTQNTQLSSQWGGVSNPQKHCHKSNPTLLCPGSSFAMKSSSQWHINSNLQGQPRMERNTNPAYFIFVVSSTQTLKW